ncbi:RnfH family protein [Marilutibacter chinensis]|uniref:UPF0125 protein L3V18_00625 n=1 Tax=Marilutibacter chinensis TaxID=2912247 RepID=A0ABS9HMQ2_9GAMM|nr:RnfH family protein [Lysobacter chinensis]MCF7220296.1 RnfH family protein [Lysobacter chinensis]
MKIELLRAWPRRSDSVRVELPEGACVADALAAAGWASLEEVAGYSIHGRRAAPATQLRDGDRLELLRALTLDPKEARRRRAEARPLRKPR